MYKFTKKDYYQAYIRANDFQAEYPYSIYFKDVIILESICCYLLRKNEEFAYNFEFFEKNFFFLEEYEYMTYLKALHLYNALKHDSVTYYKIKETSDYIESLLKKENHKYYDKLKQIYIEVLNIHLSHTNRISKVNIARKRCDIVLKQLNNILLNNDMIQKLNSNSVAQSKKYIQICNKTLQESLKR